MYNKTILIMLNVLWDFICGSSLILNIKPFTKPHNSLWINKNPDNNLFGYLIFSWGFNELLWCQKRFKGINKYFLYI